MQEEGTPYVHINRPRNPRFLVRVRGYGCRNYQVVGRHRTLEAALVALGKAWAKDSRRLNYKRGDILMVTNDYYDPVVLDEIVR